MSKRHNPEMEFGANRLALVDGHIAPAQDTAPRDRNSPYLLHPKAHTLT
ncbi:hypothetical protein [Crocosphaera sp. Alani8]